MSVPVLVAEETRGLLWRTCAPRPTWWNSRRFHRPSAATRSSGCVTGAVTGVRDRYRNRDRDRRGICEGNPGGIYEGEHLEILRGAPVARRDLQHRLRVDVHTPLRTTLRAWEALVKLVQHLVQPLRRLRLEQELVAVLPLDALKR